jgi:hypothetical protein
LLEIVLSDTQRSRNVIEDIEMGKDTLLAAVFAAVASQMPLKTTDEWLSRTVYCNTSM